MNLNDAEDRDSIAAHIAGMQKEMLKASPNYEYLMDSISRTYSERRLWISKQIPSVADVVEKYPALTTSTIVSIHIHLFHHGTVTWVCVAGLIPSKGTIAWLTCTLWPVPGHTFKCSCRTVILFTTAFTITLQDIKNKSYICESLV